MCSLSMLLWSFFDDSGLDGDFSGFQWWALVVMMAQVSHCGTAVWSIRCLLNFKQARFGPKARKSWTSVTWDPNKIMIWVINATIPRGFRWSTNWNFWWNGWTSNKWTFLCRTLEDTQTIILARCQSSPGNIIGGEWQIAYPKCGVSFPCAKSSLDKENWMFPSGQTLSNSSISLLTFSPSLLSSIDAASSVTTVAIADQLQGGDSVRFVESDSVRLTVSILVRLTGFTIVRLGESILIWSTVSALVWLTGFTIVRLTVSTDLRLTASVTARLTA